MEVRQPTVLLVEDNDDNRIIYSTYLTHSGFRVIEAADGEQGLALARSEQPDVVLMDVSIPVVDGWEATRRADLRRVDFSGSGRLTRQPRLSEVPAAGAIMDRALNGRQARRRSLTRAPITT